MVIEVIKAGQVQWLTYPIPAILEVEIRRITVQDQPKQKFNETPISTNS
jgi:hypothetical protein